MAEFVEEFDCFRSPVTLMDMDPRLEIMNDFPELNSTVMENHSLGLMCFSNDAFLSQQLDSMAPYIGSSSNPPARCPAPMSVTWPEVSTGTGHCRRIRRKKEFAEVDSAIVFGSVVPPENGSDAEVKAIRKSSSCRGKDRCSGKEEKSEEVVHVRAKRGQATDRHSLAERVRREKINEKMRCLKGLVPGCYKAMGMAGMLDEIISYVQSLQKQVEFLSMKLSAASAVFDFNLDQLDAAAVVPPPLLPEVCGADDLQEVDRLMREGSEGRRTSFHPTMHF